jgi:hypothetical protein
LARGIPVIPVLVGNADIPSEADLPPSLSPLAFRQGIAVRPDPDFHHDMDRLTAALQTFLRSVRRADPVASPTDSRSVSNIGGAQDKAVTEKPVDVVSSDESDSSAALESTPGELQTVRAAVARLAAAGINQEISNLAPVARELIRSIRGREVIALCRIIGDTTVPELDRYKAVKLMGLAIRQQVSKPFVGLALDTLLDYGILSSSLQTASLEALMTSAAQPKAKWERLFAALDLANDQQMYWIIHNLGQVIPPSERQATGARLVEILETSNAATPVICNILREIGYRTGVPSLISITEMSGPAKAANIVGVLADWRTIDAGPAIREVIERARYSTDYNVAALMVHLYRLEGVVAIGYLTEVLRDAPATLQKNILSNMSDINDSGFLDVVSELATNSLDDALKKQAQAFVQKKR